MDLLDLKADEAWQAHQQAWLETQLEGIQARVGEHLRLSESQLSCPACQCPVFQLEAVYGPQTLTRCAACGVGRRELHTPTLIHGYYGAWLALPQVIQAAEEALERVEAGGWMRAQPHFGAFVPSAAYGSEFCRKENGLRVLSKRLAALKKQASEL